MSVSAKCGPEADIGRESVTLRGDGRRDRERPSNDRTCYRDMDVDGASAHRRSLVPTAAEYGGQRAFVPAIHGALPLTTRRSHVGG